MLATVMAMRYERGVGAIGVGYVSAECVWAVGMMLCGVEYEDSRIITSLESSATLYREGMMREI